MPPAPMKPMRRGRSAMVSSSSGESGRQLQALLDGLRADDVAVHPQVSGAEAQRHTNELGQMENGEIDGRLLLLCRVGLIAVEVEVAERARRDQALGSLALRLDHMVSGHLDRVVRVHGDDGKAAAEGGPLVFDRFAAERLDDLLEVRISSGMFLEAKAARRAEYVAAVKGTNAQTSERTLDQGFQAVEAKVLDEDP